MKTSDILFGAAAIAGTAAFLTWYGSAFPAAGIELDLPRDAVEARAEQYVRELGVDPDTFLSTLTFVSDANAATFLQQVRGIEAMGRFSRETLPLWAWQARWFRSEEVEEYRLRLAPDGRPLRFRHTIPEAAGGDSLPQDSALAIASRFVSGQLGIDLDDWRLEDRSTQTRDNRLDHSFTWERIGSEIEWRPDDPEAGTASLRIHVRVQGSEIGSFSRFLEVPERFQRERASEASQGLLLSLISLGLSAVLVIIALVYVIRLYKADRIRWGPGIVFGAIAGVTVLVAGVLSYPSVKAGYQTEIPFTIYVSIALIGGLLGAALIGVAVMVAGSSGESLTEDVFPEALRSFRDWVSGRVFTSAAGASVLRGYAVGLAFLGYITVFYIVGRRYLGVWLPAEGPYSQLLGMYLPWLVPLLIATQAAVSEEVIYRLFGVSLLKRWTGVTVVALLIPAMIWAFGHSTYPVFPVYVRGIELTIAGLVFGWVFIRYGLIAMLVAHFAIDAILLAMPLLGAAGGSYVRYGIVALAIAAVPLAVPIVGWARRPAPAEGGSPTAGPPSA